MSDLTALPESFAAGTTVKYTRTHSGYNASDGWGLTLTLAGKGHLSVTAAASGASHVVTLTAAATAALPAGVYTWVERVAKAGEVHQVDAGQVTVTPDVAAAGAGQLEDPDEKLLAVVEARIAGRLTDDVAEAYAIAGRSLNRIPVAELLRIRNQLRTAVNRRRGGVLGRQHRVTFTR